MEHVDAQSIAVVKMRLPYTDRRSLSQAWLSALALTGGRPVAAQRPAAAGVCPSSRGACCSLRTQAEPAAVERASAPRAAAMRAAHSSSAGSDISVRRYRPGPAHVSARRSLPQTRSYAAFGTSLTLAGDGGRVQLVLRRDGETLRVVALCAAANVEIVRRALACAQVHLRARGETLHAAVHESAARS